MDLIFVHILLVSIWLGFCKMFNSFFSSLVFHCFIFCWNRSTTQAALYCSPNSLPIPYFTSCIICNFVVQEKYKNKPWLLVNEMGQSQYRGYLEGAPSASYYLLMMQGKEFVAIPAGSWYAWHICYVLSTCTSQNTTFPLSHWSPCLRGNSTSSFWCLSK